MTNSSSPKSLLSVSSLGLVMTCASSPACFYNPVGSFGATQASSSETNDGPTGSSATTEASSSEAGPTSTTTGSTTATSTSEPLPDPPQVPALQLTFSQVKQFGFSWSIATGATYYQLLELRPGDAEYAHLGDDIVGTSVSQTMPLHFRLGASYMLRACNEGGCTDSDSVDVVDSMATAVGYFKASNTDVSDNFGGGIALSADGNTLAVTAPREDSAASGIDGNGADNSLDSAGAVYVFFRTNGVWSQQAYIKASTPDIQDHFGQSVTLSADGNTLAVGAPQENSAATGINGEESDNSLNDTGAVYVFTRTNQAWSQQAYVKASNTGEYDWFGSSLALSGDGDTLVVGARSESSASAGINGNQGDNAVGGAGAAYVFARSNGIWSQQAYIKASNPGEGHIFGGAVALSVDGNTLAVGAMGETSAATGINGDQADSSFVNAGAAYVFVRSNGTWSQQAYVKASNTGDSDYFGYSVALSGDGDTLVVSGYGEDSAASGIGGDQNDESAEGAGAVYVFTRANGTWAQRAYIKASNSAQYNIFGHSVALSSDGMTLAVGAKQEESAAVGIGGDQADDSADVAGAAYVFVRTGDEWTQHAYVKAPNTGTNDRFGSSIALSADGTTLAVGAESESSAALGVGGDQNDNTAQSSGAVYLF